MAQRTGFVELDGRRIAYAMVGDGPPLVLPAWWVSNLVEDWSSTAFRGFVEALAKRYRVLRYDRLGTGLSDRDRWGTPRRARSARHARDAWPRTRR